MNPRPYPTPTTAAPFLNPGITATQSAFASCSAFTSPLPVVIESSTATALVTLAVTSFAAGIAPAPIIAKTKITVARILVNLIVDLCRRLKRPHINRTGSADNFVGSAKNLKQPQHLTGPFR